MRGSTSQLFKLLKRLKLLKPNNERNTDMKLQEALKGMKVNNWEMRINDKGRRVVYVRFSEKPAPITVTVNEDE